MTRYLITFDGGAMDHIPAEELPDVAKAARAAVQEAVDAGVFVFAGGLERQQASVVGTDGLVTDGPYPETKEVIGGLVVVDVASREEALNWAATIAAGCRCAQEVRELLPDPGLDAMLRGSAPRTEVVPDHVRGDLRADPRALDVGRAGVDSAPDPGLDDLRDGL
ncbi:Uncharacterized conserved protein [Micromonospora mirobrigensis]|uniref:Uncharacterized conserved protein n=1 Tax=Micromonospora mirobrigensis TaxID=262898 RepID=A0A1C4Z4B8_9ACTN|nr:Uncharacterized conserved protein [Micromonospora mirobrigensis]